MRTWGAVGEGGCRQDERHCRRRHYHSDCADAGPGPEGIEKYCCRDEPHHSPQRQQPFTQGMKRFENT